MKECWTSLTDDPDRNMADYSRPDIDCLHTTGQNFSLPSRMTICLRHLHYTFGNTLTSSYASGFGFGTINSDWTDMLEGIDVDFYPTDSVTSMTILDHLRSVLRRLGVRSVVGLEREREAGW